MKCVVTGGAGFIGSNLAEELLKQGNEVIVIDDLSTGNYENIKGLKDINFVQGSITDLDLLKKSFKDCDVVFHQAAIPSVSRSIENPKATSEVNMMGTINVLIAARDSGVGRVVAASSSSVYGDTVELPKVETMSLNPKSPYSLTKMVGEKLCKQFNEFYGLESFCLRYFNVFGPRQNPNSDYAAVIPKFIKLMLNGKRPTIYGDGKQTRDFTFIKDVVKANILASKAKKANGEAINIAYQKNIDLNELVRLLNEMIGTKIIAEYSDSREGDVKDSLADINLAKKFLGYEPDYTLETGLIKTIEWLKKSG